MIGSYIIRTYYSRCFICNDFASTWVGVSFYSKWEGNHAAGTPDVRKIEEEIKRKKEMEEEDKKAEEKEIKKGKKENKQNKKNENKEEKKEEKLEVQDFLKGREEYIQYANNPQFLIDNKSEKEVEFLVNLSQNDGLNKVGRFCKDERYPFESKIHRTVMFIFTSEGKKRVK